MCDFKPGDEVVCVDATPTINPNLIGPSPVRGSVYVVCGFDDCRFDVVGLLLSGLGHAVSNGSIVGWRPSRFRKVERRNDSMSIEAFLTIKPGFEEPRREPAKKRERV